MAVVVLGVRVESVVASSLGVFLVSGGVGCGVGWCWDVWWRRGVGWWLVGCGGGVVCGVVWVGLCCIYFREVGVWRGVGVPVRSRAVAVAAAICFVVREVGRFAWWCWPLVCGSWLESRVVWAR